MNSTFLKFGFRLNRRLKSAGLSDTPLVEYLKRRTRERLGRTDVMLATVERNVREFGSGNIKSEQLAVAECSKQASFYIAETW